MHVFLTLAFFSALQTAMAGLLPIEKLHQQAYIGAGFKAKTMCSGVFVSGRDEKRVEAQDFLLQGLSLRLIRTSVDYQNKCVTALLLPRGLVKRTACFEPEFGCRLVDLGTTSLPPHVFKGINKKNLPEAPLATNLNPKLNEIVNQAFSRPRLNTRSILVLHKDKLVAEKYADGFGLNTRMHGWSMSKSVTNALMGILVKENAFSLNRNMLFPEWTISPYSRIDIESLLEMSSGLRFDENYDEPLSDVNQMLFATADMGAFALNKPMDASVGEVWQYSSGTTNILQRAMKRSFASLSDYLRFPYQKLFGLIGMTSAIFEVDPSGTFVGSSYLYATTRDWARFGSLLLHQGRQGNTQILPTTWVAESTRSAPKAPNGKYGRQFWTNHGINDRGEGRPWPLLPTDAFAAIGYDGQTILVVPSYELVIVRFGHTKPETLWDINAFGSAVIGSL